MQITVTFRHIEPSEGLRQYAEKRLRRLARVLGDGAEVRVVMSVEKFRHRAEVSVSARRVAVASAEETEDMFILYFGGRFAYYIPKRVTGREADSLRVLLHEQLGTRGLESRYRPI
jgi:ribosomal subunit interface protein